MSTLSVETGDGLPARVFISHAYDDAAAVRTLIDLLPDEVDPVVFPRLDVDPKNAVSNGIVATILSCDGLIYLESIRSAESLWVNFERDYARRAGLKVFAFDPTTSVIRVDHTAPVPLEIQIIVSDAGRARADELLDWLATQRRFAFDTRPTRLRRLKEILFDIYDLISYDRTCLWLVDEAMLSIAVFALDGAHGAGDVLTDMFADDFAPEDRPDDDYLEWLIRNGLFVRLDASWDPDSIVEGDFEYHEEYEGKSFLGSRFIRQSFGNGRAIDLVSAADTTAIDWNRADDLLVRLTFMVQEHLRR